MGRKVTPEEAAEEVTRAVEAVQRTEAGEAWLLANVPDVPVRAKAIAALREEAARVKAHVATRLAELPDP